MIKIGILEATSRERDRSGPLSASLRIKISGVPGDGFGQFDSLAGLVDAEYPGIMTLGAAHPKWPGLYVDRVRERPLGKSSSDRLAVYEVDVSYARLEMPPASGNPDDPDEPTFGESSISGSAGGRQVTTTRDWEGNDVKVSWTDEAGKVDTQSPAIPKIVIMPDLRVSRRERISYQRLVTKIIENVGCVNDGPWHIDQTALPRTWLLNDIQYTSDDGGRTYNVTYIFSNDLGGYDVEVWYKDKDGTRKIGGERKQVQVYRMVNFDALALWPA